MKKLFLLFDKYKSFEDNLKQDRLWLYRMLQIVKSGVKYLITIFFSAFIFISVTFILYRTPFGKYLGDSVVISTLFQFFYVYLFFLTPPILYILAFGRNKISLHPLIIAIIYSTLTNFLSFKSYWVEGIAVIIVLVSFVTLIHQTIIDLIKIYKDEETLNLNIIRNRKINLALNSFIIALLFFSFIFSSLKFNYNQVELEQSIKQNPYDYRNYLVLGIRQSNNDYHKTARILFLKAFMYNPTSTLSLFCLFGDELIDISSRPRIVY